MAPKVPRQAVDDAEQDMEKDDVAAQLGQLADELKAVAADKVARTAKLKQIEELLGSLQLRDYAELAESPVVQSLVKLFGGDLRPGETRNRGTLAEVTRDWTIRDMEEQFEQVTFVPAFKKDFTWNGVGPFRMEPGEECTVPAPIYTEYKRVLEAQKQAVIHEKWMLGKSEQAPHPNWQSPEGAAVRAWSIHGRQYGKPGGILETGRIIAEPVKEEAAGG